MSPDTVKFIHVFEKNNITAPASVLENHIWAGVGNGLREGIFDFGPKDEVSSVFASVIRHPEFFAGAAEYLASQKETFLTQGRIPEIMIHMGWLPNLDVIFAVTLIKGTLEGIFREMASGMASGMPEQKPEAGMTARLRGKCERAEIAGLVTDIWERLYTTQVLEKLEDYITCINAGRHKYLAMPCLYGYYCKIGEPESRSLDENGVAVDQESIEAARREIRRRSILFAEEGSALIGKVIEALRSDISIDLFRQPVEEYLPGGWRPEHDSETRKCLDAMLTNYAADKDNGAVKISSVDVWNREDQRFEPVKAAVWVKVASSEDEYAIARELDHCVLTVYPNRIRKNDGTGAKTTSVIIALNPETEGVEKFTLRPLAEILEQCEQLEEDKLFAATGSYRRDRSGPRRSSGWFSETPFSITRDPWYMLQNEDYITVPTGGSILPYELILSAVRNQSSMTREVSFLSFISEGETILVRREDAQNKPMSFGELYRYSAGMIRKMQTEAAMRHLFAVVKINSSMLEFSNALLRSICLNMVGKADSAAVQSEDSFRMLDYRTCLYNDSTITILVTTDEASLAWKEHLLGGKLEETPICTDIRKLLEQQEELRAISREMTGSKDEAGMSGSKVAALNRRLVRINTRIQTDSIIVDPMQQDMYGFLQNGFRIQEQKEAVTSSASLLIENAEQTSDKKTQAIMGLFAMLGIASALVDCFDFIHKFVAEFPAIGSGEWFAEVVFILIIAVIGGMTLKVAIESIIDAFWNDK